MSTSGGCETLRDAHPPPRWLIRIEDGLQPCRPKKRPMIGTEEQARQVHPVGRLPPLLLGIHPRSPPRHRVRQDEAIRGHQPDRSIPGLAGSRLRTGLPGPPPSHRGDPQVPGHRLLRRTLLPIFAARSARYPDRFAVRPRRQRPDGLRDQVVPAAHRPLRRRRGRAQGQGAGRRASPPHHPAGADRPWGRLETPPPLVILLPRHPFGRVVRTSTSGAVISRSGVGASGRHGDASCSGRPGRPAPRLVRSRPTATLSRPCMRPGRRGLTAEQPPTENRPDRPKIGRSTGGGPARPPGSSSP